MTTLTTTIALPSAACATAAAPFVSPRYSFLNTQEIAATIADAGFSLVSASQSIRGKYPAARRHLLRFRREELTTKEYVPELLVFNSHDARSALRLKLGVFRFACANGLVVGRTFADIRIPHNEIARNRVIEGVFTVLDQHNALRKKVHAMRERGLTRTQREDFAAKAFELRYEVADDDDVGIKNRLAFSESCDAVAREADVGNDLWRLYNRTQERLLLGRFSLSQRYSNSTIRREVHARPITQLSRSARINSDLWDLAESFISV